jgi:predicted DNA-binding transcriptional regulator AlpA
MPENEDKSTPCRLLTKKQVLQIIPLSYSTIWEMTRRGEFPRAIQICGSNRVAYLETEILEWIRSRPRQELKEMIDGEESKI